MSKICLFVALSLVFLTGCVPGFGGKGEPRPLTASVVYATTSPQPVTPASLPAGSLAPLPTVTLLAPTSSPPPTSTPAPTASLTPGFTPTQTPTYTPAPTASHTPDFTPSQTPTLGPSPTATPAPPLLTPGVLDRMDPLSLVRWLKYGLDHKDISYIEPLLAENIQYSFAFSDAPGKTLAKAAFLSELKRRLVHGPSCYSYYFLPGTPNYLYVSTQAWNPPWEFQGSELNYLLLIFSDRTTRTKGLYLYGAFVSWFPGILDAPETTCQ